MFSRPFLAAILLAAAASAQSFEELLAQTPELSLFSTLLKLNSSFTDFITQQTNDGVQTILVPNNEAVLSFMQKNQIKSPADIPADLVIPYLSYHVIPKNITSKMFLVPGGTVVETKLKDERYTLLKGNSGQAIYGKPSASSQVAKGVVIESGLGDQINIVKPDVKYNKGVVHIVDGLLTFPVNCSKTIADQGADQLVQIIKRVNLLETLDTTPGATCFAPSDAAIKEALPVLQTLTDKQVKDAILFHTLLDPYFTSDLFDGQTIPTALGPNITVNVKDTEYYFNGVKAMTVNGIAKNGATYLLEGIMSPDFTGMPSETTTTSISKTTALTTATNTATVTQGNGGNATFTSSAAPTATSEARSGAGILQVGGSLLLSGLVAVLAAF